MPLRFPLSDVKIEFSSEKLEVEDALYDDGFFRLNQNEFSMNVEEIGWFYASGGNYVRIIPHEGVSESNLEVYLNGSVYGAILHQRMIMPLHGSSFVHKGLGIMLCGESGAGKSSLTASFIKAGSTFLTDDVSPIVFQDDLPFILPMSDRIKLWEDSLSQLEFEKGELAQIWKDYQKFYLPIDSTTSEPNPLHVIFLIEKHDNDTVKFEKVKGIERFTAIRNEIYRWEYLQGMPDSEAQYLNQLKSITANVTVFKVIRPEVIEIDSMRGILEDFVADQGLLSINEKSA